MNEQLIKFIELCLVDGVITDKDREVIFRKSKEFGVPKDECEIILEGMTLKHSNESSQKNISIENNDGKSIDDDIINIEKLNHEETSEETLREIFESSFNIKIRENNKKIENINTEINHIDEKLKPLDEKLKQIDNIQKEMLSENKKLINDTKFNREEFENKLNDFINKLEIDLKYLNFELSSKTPKFYFLKKNFFGVKSKGDEFTITWIEFFERNEFENKYYLNEVDLKLVFDIKKIYESILSFVKKPGEEYEKKLDKNEKLLIQNNYDSRATKMEWFEMDLHKRNKTKNINEIKKEIEKIKKIINPSNFKYFKKLYNESPILYQSKIFSKYLQVLEVENTKEVENLTRFLNFIIDTEKNYSVKIVLSFKKLMNGELLSDELSSLFNQKKNLITTYNSFHIMYQSLVTKKIGLYMKMYVEWESTGIFNTFYEKNVLDKLDIMNEYFQKLNNTVEVVCREISKTNDYLSLLNTTMYDMKLSVDETNLNLQDISNSIEKGNMMLEKGNNLLDGIKSGVGLNNLLTGIQTYQMYRINKNTKSLRE
ncbi:hypothetical protein N9H82_01130 [Flavobacteriaceae bacterium]|nr:hypothetical protein [Flavobacteriaceae bacterium]